MSITPAELNTKLQQIHALLNQARTMFECIGLELEALEPNEYIGFDFIGETDFADLASATEEVEATIYTLLNPET